MADRKDRIAILKQQSLRTKPVLGRTKNVFVRQLSVQTTQSDGCPLVKAQRAALFRTVRPPGRCLPFSLCAFFQISPHGNDRGVASHRYPVLPMAISNWNARNIYSAIKTIWH